MTRQSESLIKRQNSAHGDSGLALIFILRGAISAGGIWRCALLVLCGTAMDTFSPQPKRAWLKIAAHQQDYRSFAKAKAMLNRIKWRAILPRHFNDAREVGGRERRIWSCWHFGFTCGFECLLALKLARGVEKSISIVISALRNHRSVIGEFIDQPVFLVDPP